MHKLYRDMNGIAGATAIADNIQFASVLESLCHIRAQRFDLASVLIEKALLHLHALMAFAHDFVAHRINSIHLTLHPASMKFARRSMNATSPRTARTASRYLLQSISLIGDMPFNVP